MKPAPPKWNLIPESANPPIRCELVVRELKRIYREEIDHRMSLELSGVQDPARQGVELPRFRLGLIERDTEEYDERVRETKSGGGRGEVYVLHSDYNSILTYCGERGKVALRGRRRSQRASYWVYHITIVSLLILILIITCNVGAFESYNIVCVGPRAYLQLYYGYNFYKK